MFIWFSMIWKSSPGWGILPASILDHTWKRNQGHIDIIFGGMWMNPCCSYRHVIQRNLKGSSADKLSLNSWRIKASYFRSGVVLRRFTVEEEEGHHACVDLVVKQPLSPTRSRLAHTRKRVKAKETFRLNHWQNDKAHLARTIMMTRNLMTLRIWAVCRRNPPGGKLSPRMERSGYFCCSIPAYCWNTCNG